MTSEELPEPIRKHLEQEGARLTSQAWNLAMKLSTDLAMELEENLVKGLPGLTAEGLASILTGCHLSQAVVTMFIRYFPDMDDDYSAKLSNEIKNRLSHVMEEELERLKRDLN